MGTTDAKGVMRQGIEVWGQWFCGMFSVLYAHNCSMHCEPSHTVWTSVRNSVHINTQPVTNAFHERKLQAEERKQVVLGEFGVLGYLLVSCKPRATSDRLCLLQHHAVNTLHSEVHAPCSSYTERGGKKCYSEWFPSPVLRRETAEDRIWHALEEKLMELNP